MHIERLNKEIEKIKEFPDNFNGYGSPCPNELAYQAVNSVISKINDDAFLEHTKATIDCIGGVALLVCSPYFSDRYVQITCDNDGDVIFLLADCAEEKSSAYDIKEDGFSFCLSNAKSFLNNFEPLETND